ncbi:MAG: DEAD/DEAH box helicase [Betaproteobacteria bacterium]|nr:DEAD/DEAH box helicase [Betaproteobacteria bacterium]
MNTSFQNLGLSAELLRAVAEQGYTEPTPIQAQAIPVVLSGRDLLGAAQTGTGKTAGFTLPMLNLLSNHASYKNAASTSPARHPVRALILVPTRELAAQVQDSVRVYGKHLRLRSAAIFGGMGIGPQIAELRRGVDIVVATPGRLLDHVQQRTIDLRSIEILVLDEADRMLDMGFIHDIRRILGLLPPKRQNLLFSATFSDEIRRLSSQFLHDPVTVEVARRNAPIELIGQVAHPVDKDRKRELLSHLVKTNNWQQVLVFTKTKHGANRLAQQLEDDGIDADAIHGNKSQPQRTRTLKRFKDNELQVLVATDIAARGIDIDALPHVVNYDLPNVSEDYVHRIGRTGRAGITGAAVSLVSGEDRPLMAAIERLINKKVELRVVPGFEPSKAYQTARHVPEERKSQQRQGRKPQRAANPQSRQGRAGKPSSESRRDRPVEGKRRRQSEERVQPRSAARRPDQDERIAQAQHYKKVEREAQPAAARAKSSSISSLFGIFGRKAA